MDNTNPQENPSIKKGMNPLLVVGIFALIAIAGFVLLSGNKKTANQTTNTASQDQTVVPTSVPTVTAADTPATDSKAAEQVKTIAVEGGGFYFLPKEIRVKKGDKVKVVFTNKGGRHNFVIDQFNVQTNVVATGETAQAEFTADKAGTFEYYCSVGNHRQMGMKGNLIVE